MEYAYQHSQGQRVLRQRNLLAMVALGLAAIIVILFTISASRDREIVLQPVLQSPLTISSAGVSRQYLELVTRDTSQLILNRSPDNLDYWLTSIVQLCTPQARGRIKADMLKIADEQRGSSISQFFTIDTMDIDPKQLRSTVSGTLNTIAGQKIIASQKRTFQFDWEYSGLSLKLAGFGMLRPAEKKLGDPA